MARTVIQDPLLKFSFRVSIPGVPNTMGFQKVSGLTKEINVVEYDESGYAHTHKLIGREKTGEVTLERGMYADSQGMSLEDIFKTYSAQRTTVTIEQLDKEGKSVREWTLAEAWFSKWEGSDFDAGSEDVAIEKLTIQFEYYLD